MIKLPRVLPAEKIESKWLLGEAENSEMPYAAKKPKRRIPVLYMAS